MNTIDEIRILASWMMKPQH